MKKRLALFLLILTLILNPIILTKTNASTSYTIYINNSKTNIQTSTQKGLVFVSEDLVKQMGDSISRKGNSVIVRKGNKELKFVAGKNSYSINGKSKKISSKNVSVRVVKNKAFLPLTVLQYELGYKVQIKGRNIYITKPTNNSTSNNSYITPSPNAKYNTNTVNNPNFKNAKLTGNPIYDYYLRKPYRKAGTINQMTWARLLPNLGKRPIANDKLTLINGRILNQQMKEELLKYYSENELKNMKWTMPYLDKFATDNWEQDAETLRSSLEMHYFAPAVDKSIAYSPDEIEGGWEVLQLNYSEEYKTYGMWYRYSFYDETDVTGHSIAKMNFIEPQILRFYFPTKWELIWDNIVGNNAGGVLQRGVIYQLDGREFFASSSQPVLHWTKKGGKIDRKLFQDELKKGYNGKTVIIK